MTDDRANEETPAVPATIPQPVLGNLGEFDSRTNSIASYLERMQLYFEANAVADDRKVAVLLTVIGAKTYETLRSLLAPERPRDQTYDQLVSALLKHYDPKPLVIGERFRFYQRSQRAGESIANFIADLRRLSIRCEFGDFLDQALRDRFVCGVRNDALQRKLLTEADLTIKRAQEIAQSMESADLNSKDLKGDASARDYSDSIHHAPTSPASPSLNAGQGKKFQPCHRCGRRHDARTCKFKDATCHKCGKQGHIRPACRSGSPPSADRGGRKNNGRPYQRRQRSGSNKWLEADEEDKDALPLFVLEGDVPQPPILITMSLNGCPVEFELDTGATVTVMSELKFQECFPDHPLEQSSLRLKTYTGETMNVVGESTFDVSYSDQGSKSLTLAVVAGSGPALLGRNWLQHFVLEWQQIKSVLLANDTLRQLLLDHSEVFQDGLGTITPFKAQILVSSSAVPRFHRPRPVPYALRPLVELELDRLTQSGVLEPVSHSDWAAPIVTVPKRDGEVRICGDYKVTVNPALDVDQYPLPRPEDLFATLAGGKYFSTMDLSHAYNQLPLDDKSRQFLVINTQRGLYEYTRLPFGVASAPSIFQKTMDTILQGMNGVICYLDDILISGKTEEEHLDNLRRVLLKLKEHGIRAKKAKCTFLKTSVRYLGHVIDADGLHATDDKIKAIVNAPRPRTVAELRSFLGLLNYYGRFIPNLSSLIYPLNNLLRQKTTWRWTKACSDAFTAAKEQIVSSNVLTHYDTTLPVRLAADASAYGIGAVISHVMEDGSERPIAFASRTLKPSERNYAQVEKEALSLVFGVCKFHSYLYGRKFTLVTDHKPLTTILGPKNGVPPIAAARLQRWALKLAAYNYEIEFRSTDKHANADGLSRLPLNHVEPLGYTSEPTVFNLQQIGSLPVTAAKLAAATRNDKVLSRVYRYVTKGWPRQVDSSLAPFAAKKMELTVEGGCVLWGIRVIIPNKWRERLLLELHRDHPGICKMKSIARSYMWWPGMDHSIEELVKSCPDCQAIGKAPPVTPLQPWERPTRVFQRLHIDFAGPFQGAMFFVVVDAYSKWPCVSILQSTTVEKTINELRQLFAAYGIPEQIVSDNGSQFTSEPFAIFMKMNGIRHTLTAPYHPATNGLAERFVQSLKHGLKASLSSGLSLSRRLCNFLMMYRSAVHSTTGVTPSSLFLNRELRSRFDLLRPDHDADVARRQARQKEQHDRRSPTRHFVVGDLVMARNYRSGPDWIPATVVSKLGPLSYLLETEDKQLWRRHIDQVKSRANSPVSPSPTVPEAVPDSVWEAPASGPTDPEPESETGHQSPVPEPVEQEPDSGDNGTPSSADSVVAPTQESGRYPQRHRQVPNYYRPSI